MKLWTPWWSPWPSSNLHSQTPRLCCSLHCLHNKICFLLAPRVHLQLWGFPFQASDLLTKHLPVILSILKSRTMWRQADCLPTNQARTARRAEDFHFCLMEKNFLKISPCWETNLKVCSLTFWLHQNKALFTIQQHFPGKNGSRFASTTDGAVG